MIEQGELTEQPTFSELIKLRVREFVERDDRPETPKILAHQIVDEKQSEIDEIMVAARVRERGLGYTINHRYIADMLVNARAIEIARREMAEKSELSPEDEAEIESLHYQMWRDECRVKYGDEMCDFIERMLEEKQHTFNF